MTFAIPINRRPLQAELPDDEVKIVKLEDAQMTTQIPLVLARPRNRCQKPPTRIMCGRAAGSIRELALVLLHVSVFFALAMVKNCYAMAVPQPIQSFHVEYLVADGPSPEAIAALRHLLDSPPRGRPPESSAQPAGTWSVVMEECEEEDNTESRILEEVVRSIWPKATLSTRGCGHMKPGRLQFTVTVIPPIFGAINTYVKVVTCTDSSCEVVMGGPDLNGPNPFGPVKPGTIVVD